MSKNIGKKLITPKPSASIKNKESLVGTGNVVPVIKGAANSKETVTKPVNKSRVPQAISKPIPSISSTNLKKIMSNTTGVSAANSPRNKSVPMKATIPMISTKNTGTVKKVPDVKKDRTKFKTADVLQKAKVSAAPSPAKSHSIMTLIQNVTISSPPPQRKEMPIEKTIDEQFEVVQSLSPRIRERTRTRTLEPHEVILHQRNIAHAISQHVVESTLAPDSLEISDAEISLISDESEPIKIKTPVSFEINFEEPIKLSPKKLSRIVEPIKKMNESEYDDYADDFESYESDFESERSTSVSSNNSDDSCENNSDASEISDDNSATYTKSGTSMDNTYKVNLDDRKFDSGNYDMDMKGDSNSIVNIKLRRQEPLNSAFEENDESNTNDSGLGYFEAIRTTNLTSLPRVTQQLTITKIKTTPHNTRGYELMQKIHLDEMQFSLFELKPMTYEYYMKIFGNYNSGQNLTQTNDDRIQQEIQTDVNFVKTIWTQNPPCLTKSSLENCLSKSYYYDKIGVGYDTEEDDANQGEPIKGTNGSEMTIDKYNRLNDLLQTALVTIADIIYRKSKNNRFNQTAMPMSNGYRPIKCNRIVNIFSFNSFVITIQEEPDRNLIYVWNLYSLETPYRVLSCWSNIQCLILLNQCIVICGLSNGSISLWDLREPYYWHTEMLNNCNVRTASQIILPDLGSDMLQENKDFGRTIDLKLMDIGEQVDMLSSYNAIQLCTLHEYGLVTIWTFIEHKQCTFDPNGTLTKTSNYLNNISLWSRINLIQNSALNLNQYFFTIEQNPKLSRNKTALRNTIDYFDNNIFNDRILQELNKTNDNTSGKLCVKKNLNYSKIEYIAKYGYFVNLSKNYLLFINKSLKLTDIRKIFIDSNKLIKCINFQTFSQNKLFIVFLSDGSCKVLPVLNYFNQFHQNGHSKISVQIADSQPSGSGTLIFKSGTSITNDMLVASKSCTIQNMIKDERQIYSIEHALNYFDLPEIKLMNTKGGSSTSFLSSASKSIKTIKLINSNDLKFLLNYKTRSSDMPAINDFYLFKFNENLLLNQCHNVLYLYNIATSVQTILDQAVKHFTVIEHLNNRNYLILLTEATSSITADVIQIHELNDKLFNY